MQREHTPRGVRVGALRLGGVARSSLWRASSMSVGANRDRGWIWQRSLYPRLLLLAVTPVAAAGLVYAWTTRGAVEEALGRTIGRQLAEVARDASEGLTESIAGVSEELLHRSRDVGIREAIAGGREDGEASVAATFDHRGIVASVAGIRDRPRWTRSGPGSDATSRSSGALGCLRWSPASGADRPRDRAIGRGRDHDTRLLSSPPWRNRRRSRGPGVLGASQFRSPPFPT